MIWFQKEKKYVPAEQIKKKERFNFRKLNILDQCTEQYRTTTTPPSILIQLDQFII